MEGSLTSTRETGAEQLMRPLAWWGAGAGCCVHAGGGEPKEGPLRTGVPSLDSEQSLLGMHVRAWLHVLSETQAAELRRSWAGDESCSLRGRRWASPTECGSLRGRTRHGEGTWAELREVVIHSPCAQGQGQTVVCAGDWSLASHTLRVCTAQLSFCASCVCTRRPFLSVAS